MEHRHCKYTITGAYVCDKKKKVETFVSLPTPAAKSFSCPNYAKMTSGQKQDAACVVLKRYNTKEVNDYFDCSSRDPTDGIPTCKNKNIINTCVPADKRLMECNRCCPSVDPKAPLLTRESMQSKRDVCMLGCKKDYNASALVVKSAEVKIDPSLEADGKCVGEKQTSKKCYTEQCKKVFRLECIKAGRIVKPTTGTSTVPKSSGSTMDTKSAIKGHTCSGVCKKKAGCTGMDCDMMCEFNCA